MRLPTIQGIIRRRILVNYRVDVEVIQPLLPAPFRPKLHAGKAIAGICLIRLEHIRPRLLPSVLGISSENAAHRIAVSWDDQRGVAREGVYIPRRDTSSRLNHLAGGRLFPGEHHLAHFRVADNRTNVQMSVHAQDGGVDIELEGNSSNSLPSTSIFSSLAESSAFFETGSLGYSATSNPMRLDGIVLETKEWQVAPLEIKSIYSSYFANDAIFPAGTVAFDHALIMRDIDHSWHSADDLHVCVNAV